jgi:hypothetical protein
MHTRLLVGLVMSGVMAAFMALNAVRAAAAPANFARYMGLPLDTAPAGFVHVYAARTVFLALLPAVLLLRRDAHALSVVAGCAVVIPVGDAWLTWRAGASAATVSRHVVIAFFLVIATLLLAQ